MGEIINFHRLRPVLMLQEASYVEFSLLAVKGAQEFLKLFNRGVLYSLFSLYHSQEELIMLLLKKGVVRNTNEAAEFLENLLDREIPYTNDRKKRFVLRKEEEGYGRFFIEYIRT